ncbi:MAG: PAS domain S-box protein [Verrucomicrobiaceae bacterium]|nr:MAG: PAS domain S-box protein [Verrucomicrobiaceae bacterium]
MTLKAVDGDMVDSRLQNLADNIPGGMVFQLAVDGESRHFVYVSRGVEKLFGVSAMEAMEDAGRLYTVIEPSDLALLRDAEARAIYSTEPFVSEVRLNTGFGSRWVQISSARRLEPDGSQIWDGVVLDITDRKKAELAHTENEARLQLATDAAAIGIWHWDLGSGRMSYSPRAKDIYGFSEGEEITFAKLEALNLEDDAPVIRAKLQRALDPALRENEIFSYRIRRADTGEVRWLMAHGKAAFEVSDGVERPTSYVGTLQDVTEQKRAEIMLLESEARLRLAISAGAMAVWELDVRTNVVTPSAELNALYGFPKDATPALDDFRARYAPGETERIEAEAAQVVGRGDSQLDFEAKHIWPDGSVKWFSVRAQIINGSDGNPERLIGVVMDVTKRRAAEEQLHIVAQELQHRVKNSLTVVQTLASQTFKPNRPFPEALAAFTGRLKALASATDVMTRSDWSRGSLIEVVEVVLEPYREGFLDRFDLAGEDVSASSKVILGVGMALHELCTNALKHGALSAPGGRVSLSWRREGKWLMIDWRESGGPVVTSTPATGFGTRLLKKGIFDGIAGSIEVFFQPEGVKCFIRANLEESS